MPFFALLEPAAFLLGLLFGSFLNVCIARLPYHRSVVTPRSRCPGCDHLIRWHDNVPLLSWLLLRARCRDCRLPIPVRYPLVEVATALWFTLAAHDLAALAILPAATIGETWAMAILGALRLAILGFLVLGLMVMDWQTGLLPDAFTLTGTAIGFFLVCVQAIFLGPNEGQIILADRHLRLSSPGSFADQGNVFMTGPEALILGRLAAICGAVLLLLAIRAAYKLLRRRDGMGLGDVKMLATIAAFLGFWPAMLAMFLGVLTASLYAALLFARGRATSATRLAFGTFLGLGGLLAAQFGTRLIDAYVALLR